VRVGRLRSGELLAVVGGVALAVALLAEPVGWLASAVAVAVVLAAAWLAAATAAASTARAVAVGVLTAVVGPIAFLVLLIAGAAWPALVGSALIAIGGWRALADERTDAPESAYVAPAPRPAPPERSS
jgi:hypothetical protein